MDCSGSRVDAGRFIFHQTGQSPAAGGRKGQDGPCRRRPRFVAGGEPIRRLVRQCLRHQHADACLRYAVAQGRIRPARLRVSGRQQRQRHHLGGAGRCPAGYAWRLSQARRHVAATPAAAGGRPAHASHRGRRQSLVLPVCIDPESRGCGIRGRLARLRLERPDDSLQASAAGRWPRCVGRRADADRRRPRQQLDVARCGSSHVDADVYRQGTDQGRRPAHPRIATPSCWPGIGRARWRVSGTCHPPSAGRQASPACHPSPRGWGRPARNGGAAAGAHSPPAGSGSPFRATSAAGASAGPAG